jgi:hypothetical protein
LRKKADGDKKIQSHVSGKEISNLFHVRRNYFHGTGEESPASPEKDGGPEQLRKNYEQAYRRGAPEKIPAGGFPA